MRRAAVSTLLIAAAALAAAASPAAAAPPHPLATCFWEGPISTSQPTTRGFDGRTFNFPEESATYWLARFRLPAGTRLLLRGRYPYARYLSLNTYAGGEPIDSLSDVAIRPDRRARNPFLPGGRRDGRRRGWHVTVVDTAPGERREPNTLHAAPREEGRPIELAYRVYEPDRRRDLTGDTGLPRALLVDEQGRRRSAEETCAAVNDPDRSIPVQTTPAEQWRFATSCRDHHPAFDPIRWERFFNLDYAVSAVLLDCTEPGFAARRGVVPARSRGGFYSNRDSAYVYAHLSRAYGPVVVVEGALPTYPPTRAGQRRMAPAQLRFWSLCSGESRVTVRTPDCLADRQLPLDRRRRFTVVVSRREDRPANARRACGVAWLDWGERGDGAGNPDYGLLILRNMLVSPGFAQAIQNVTRAGDEEDVMGPYFPRARYTTTEQFEATGC